MKKRKELFEKVKEIQREDATRYRHATGQAFTKIIDQGKFSQCCCSQTINMGYGCLEKERIDKVPRNLVCDQILDKLTGMRKAHMTK